MTPDEAIAELDLMQKGGDQEYDHDRADKILLAVLRSQGMDSVAAAWEQAQSRVGFWYA